MEVLLSMHEMPDYTTILRIPNNRKSQAPFPADFLLSLFNITPFSRDFIKVLSYWEEFSAIKFKKLVWFV